MGVVLFDPLMRQDRRKTVLVVAILLLAAAVAVGARNAATRTENISSSATTPASVAPTPTTTSTTPPSTTTTAAPAAPASKPPGTTAPAKRAGVAIPEGKLVFGLGDNVYAAPAAPLVKQARVKMITSWYHGPESLAGLQNIKGKVRSTYTDGFDQHLMVWVLENPKQTVSTKYGPACGVNYPISNRFNDDMRQVAQIFAPPSGRRLYVTMFFELQAYACTSNQWKGQENYYNALKDSYRASLATFHQQAPGSAVSLGWGGWQVNYDDPSNGAGRSMISHFSDIMQASDFQSFGSLSDNRGENLSQITKFTSILHGYGNGKVMLTPFGRYIGSDDTYWPEDMAAIFNDAKIKALQAQGLFAIDLYRTENFDSSSNLQAAKSAIAKYGA